MPLFGSSDNHNKLEKHNHHPVGNDLADTGYGAGAGTTGLGRTHHETMPVTGAGMGAGMGGAGMGGAGMHEGRHHHAGAGMRDDGMMAGDNYGSTGTGMGTGMGGTDTTIPPAHAINDHNRSGTGGGAMTGKIEHAVGSMVGSKSLKAKGIQKEQEARALKVQSEELAEAERLESQASARRERAVAHGAHPHAGHLGGVPPATTGPNTNTFQ